MKKDKREKKQKKEDVKLTAAYFEKLGSQEVTNLLNKQFPVKVGYWISRIIAKVRQESKVYIDARQKLIEQYEDKEIKDKLPQGQFRIAKEHQEVFNKEILELQSAKIELAGYNIIEVELDKLPNLSITEMEFLLPMIKIKE